MNIKYIFIASLLSLILSACNKKEEDETIIQPADKLFKEAEAFMEKEKYKDAAKTYSKIYFQHPASEDGAKAELGEAYALAQMEKYEEAIDVLNDFLHLHPSHMDTAYALHQKALCYYMQMPNVYRDQSVTAKALDSLKEVVAKYPNSKYAQDASLKIDLVLDHLAGKEMEVGRLYMKKNNPVAAIPRFQEVVKKYETTSHTAEALHRLVEANLMLGLKKEALKYASILGHNYPATKWYKYSRNLLDSLDVKN
jgi:outer membrane protein assembly factor BamD